MYFAKDQEVNNSRRFKNCEELLELEQLKLEGVDLAKTNI
jgi:hypothetical protein